MHVLDVGAQGLDGGVRVLAGGAAGAVDVPQGARVVRGVVVKRQGKAGGVCIDARGLDEEVHAAVLGQGNQGVQGAVDGVVVIGLHGHADACDAGGCGHLDELGCLGHRLFSGGDVDGGVQGGDGQLALFEGAGRGLHVVAVEGGALAAQAGLVGDIVDLDAGKVLLDGGFDQLVPGAGGPASGRERTLH